MRESVCEGGREKKRGKDREEYQGEERKRGMEEREGKGRELRKFMKRSE